MSIRKRNEYLDAESSSDNDGLSDRETFADSRTAGLISRNAKRRKLDTSEPGSDGESASDSPDNTSPAAINLKAPDNSLNPSPQPDNAPEMSSTAPLSTPAKPRTIAKSIKTKHKPGVIYLSRIPPFMRPATVKTLLSTHGPISKIFLTPEPPSNYLRRKKSGGNKKRSFIDGWVEFTKKKHAKQCVDAINGQIVGGKKGGWYRDDVWNARYLRGFSWSDLMQSVRAEEREREERVRVGTKREGRERGEFLKNLERSKVEETRREKRRKREEASGKVSAEKSSAVDGKEDDMPNENDNTGSTDKKRNGFERRFRQNEVKRTTISKVPEQPDEVNRVLSKIF